MPEPLEPFISPEETGYIVASLAREIRADYEGRAPLLVGVLMGAFVFTADLARALGEIDLDVDFIQAASYGNRDEPSNEVLITRDVTTEVKGRHVIVVEGIVDRGRTAHAVVDLLKGKGCASINVCALLVRDSHSGVEVRYAGRRIGPGFVVGYGMDYKGRYRNLPGVHLLKTGNDEGG